MAMEKMDLPCLLQSKLLVSMTKLVESPEVNRITALEEKYC